ncbi:hypothetical protein BDR07DRAFT_1380611 [Suillus spraguei]|nr:hypothetical protein BDR07DRAFT_1380611 [Suillus spraguei]
MEGLGTWALCQALHAWACEGLRVASLDLSECTFSPMCPEINQLSRFNYKMTMALCKAAPKQKKSKLTSLPPPQKPQVRTSLNLNMLSVAKANLMSLSKSLQSCLATLTGKKT